MTIVYAGKLRLRLRLTPQEMQALQMDREGRVDCADPATRAVLLSYLEEARSTAFAPGRSRLLVEACPDGEGGALITFTVPPEEAGRRGMAPVVFQFEEAESLIQGAVALYGHHRHRIQKSSLYGWESGYRLIVLPLDYTDRLSVYLLGEYGRKVGEGDIAVSHTEEFGRLIAEDDALETLAFYFD